MINFDDGRKSQLIYAKPILDKYGFKASFFIICGRVGIERSSMNWQDIAELKKDGMDIESHSMTHANLNKLLTNALRFEIGVNIVPLDINYQYSKCILLYHKNN